MTKNKKRLIIGASILLVLFGAWRYWGTKKMAMAHMMSGMGGPGANTAMPLPVVGCVKQTVPEVLELTGTTAASQQVEIRARVEGVLQQMHFHEGQTVDANQLLFVIEPDLYIARRDQAQASLAGALAQKMQAESDLQRISQAVQADAVSQQDLTRAQAAVQTAQAAVQAAQAALAQAELQLSYTRIHAPIGGKITRRTVDVGNLVGAGDRTWLATIYQIKPLYIYFNISDRQLTEYLIARLKDASQPLTFTVLLPDEKPFDETGLVDYIDPAIDTTTGTAQARGVVQNQTEQLAPGLFVRVRLPVRILENAILIPQKVIQSDLQGKYVFVVGPDNKLARKSIQLGQPTGTLQVVLSGLTGDEQILAGGFAMAREGMVIQPIPTGAPETPTKKQP